MEDKKEIKDLIKVRKSIFSIIKEKIKEKLKLDKHSPSDIERERRAFQTFEELYGINEEAYAIEQENLKIYAQLGDLENPDEIIETKKEIEVEKIPETSSKEEFMELYRGVIENRVSVEELSLSDLLKINLMIKEEIEIQKTVIQESEELEKEIEMLDKENEELMKKVGNLEDEE